MKLHRVLILSVNHCPPRFNDNFQLTSFGWWLESANCSGVPYENDWMFDVEVGRSSYDIDPEAVPLIEFALSMNATHVLFCPEEPNTANLKVY